ncbi:30S ribosomal protein S16 [Arsenicicoccus sp. oral taxon 190]|uniref:30S ribosomal protein S16 n=1 Tax=Arsenicicoccus sp. oral taxon 190 TaxID=1658671 RepID=UPI00067A0AC4|nr:30S ribosomal protein S16 [Arsenicicoccus sp. oral taxon 190]AKT52244.1 30S ribosomal protein S16 [Arsenicicoccus sp. oral taxon 190]
MAVKIRLKRMGKIRAPYYRVVVMDSRTKRDGRAIEEIGLYHPTEQPSRIEIDSERAQYWLGVGAQPTEQVEALLKITGDWQKHKGLPGAEGTLQVKEPKRSKQELYNEALQKAELEPKDTPRKKAAKAETAETPAEAPADAPTAAPATTDPAEAAEAAGSAEAEEVPATESVEAAADEKTEA